MLSFELYNKGGMIRYRSLPFLSKHLNYAFFMDQKWTLEHVVPRSYMKSSYRFKKLVKDGNNIILYPSLLNSHRSNYTLTDVDQIDINHPKTVALNLYGKPISCEHMIKKEEWYGRLSWKNSESRLFVPAWPFRGEIARACQYMDNKYPELRETNAVFPRTIDPELAHNWIVAFPPTQWEKEKFAIIQQIQMMDDKGRQ